LLINGHAVTTEAPQTPDGVGGGEEFMQREVSPYASDQSCWQNPEGVFSHTEFLDAARISMIF